MCSFLEFQRLILISSHGEFRSYVLSFFLDRYYLELEIEDHVLEKKNRQHI